MVWIFRFCLTFFAFDEGCLFSSVECWSSFSCFRLTSITMCLICSRWFRYWLLFDFSTSFFFIFMFFLVEQRNVFLLVVLFCFFNSFIGYTAMVSFCLLVFVLFWLLVSFNIRERMYFFMFLVLHSYTIYVVTLCAEQFHDKWRI